MAETSVVATSGTDSNDWSLMEIEDKDLVRETRDKIEAKTEHSIIPTVTNDAIVTTSLEPTVAGVSFQVGVLSLVLSYLYTVLYLPAS